MSRIKVINDSELGRIEILEGENSLAMTNGRFGGWVSAGKDSYVSIEYARDLNRSQRRKEKIRLSDTQPNQKGKAE